MYYYLLIFGILFPSVAFAEVLVPEIPGLREHKLEYGTIVRHPDGIVGMTLAGSGVWLKINAAGFSIEDAKSEADGISFTTAKNKSGLILSAFLEPVARAKSSVDCRDYYFPKALSSPVEKSDVRQSEIGEIAIGAYKIAIRSGQQPPQEHRNAYLYKSGFCIDVHLSMANFKQQENENTFANLIASLGILDHPPESSLHPPLYKMEFGQVEFKSNGKLKMSLSETGSAISVELKNFALLDLQSNSRGAMFMADSLDEKMRLYGYLQPEENLSNADECRDKYMASVIEQNAPLNGVKESAMGEKAFAEYETDGGSTGNTYNRKLFLFQKGHCLDLHMMWHSVNGVPPTVESIQQSARFLPSER